MREAGVPLAKPEVDPLREHGSRTARHRLS